MANPFSKRAQRYSDTLTRFYGLRFEKGFMLVTNSLCLGHCKHRDNILKNKANVQNHPHFAHEIRFMCKKQPFSHIPPPWLKERQHDQSFRFSGPIPFASVRANGMGAPCTHPSNQPLIAKAVISSISDNHMVHHPDIE